MTCSQSRHNLSNINPPKPVYGKKVYTDALLVTSLKVFDASVGTNSASLGRDQVGRFSKKKPKQIKWRFLKYQFTERIRIEIGRRINDLSFVAERSDTFSKEMNSGRRKSYAVNVKAAFG